MFTDAFVMIGEKNKSCELALNLVVESAMSGGIKNSNASFVGCVTCCSSENMRRFELCDPAIVSSVSMSSSGAADSR